MELIVETIKFGEEIKIYATSDADLESKVRKVQEYIDARKGTIDRSSKLFGKLIAICWFCYLKPIALIEGDSLLWQGCISDRSLGICMIAKLICSKILQAYAQSLKSKKASRS